jgi:hypothetical protein
MNSVGELPSPSRPPAKTGRPQRLTYRFGDNDRLEPSEVISAHTQAQQSRVSGGDDLLIVSDTTYLSFLFPFRRHTAKDGLGDMNSSDIDVEGVKLHSSIGVRPDTQQMTGIVDQHLLVEDQQSETNYITNGKDEPIQIENQCGKWLRGDRAALEWVPEDVRPILVQDRGGDDPTPADILLTD